MEILDISNQILKNIIFDGYTFSNVSKTFKEKYPKLSQEDKNLVLNLVGGTLKHYLLVSHFINEKFENLSNNEICALGIALANKIFLKRIKDNDIYDFLRENINKDKIDSALKEVQEITNKEQLYFAKNGKEIDFFTKVSLQYNIPRWVCKMWKNHFKHIPPYRLYNSLKVNNPIFVSQNTLKSRNFELNNELFEVTNIDGVFKYIGKSNIHVTDEYNTHKVFVTKPVINEVLNNITVNSLMPVAVYSSFPSSFLLNYLNATDKKCTIDAMFPNISDKLHWDNEIAYYALNSVKTYECKARDIVTCVSHKVSTFFILNSGSFLDNLKNQPDYFLRSSNETLSDIIEEENQLLEEALEMTEENGTIVYIIPTANVKEGHLLIEAFVANHENVELSKEKQYLPIDEFGCCYYYAILRKK